jgi:hypothetical protein
MTSKFVWMVKTHSGLLPVRFDRRRREILPGNRNMPVKARMRTDSAGRPHYFCFLLACSSDAGLTRGDSPIEF